MSYSSAIVIGGGAFGTCIASVLSNNFKNVIVLVRSEDVYSSINQGENNVYLPGKKLSKNIHAALSWQEVDSLVEGKVELIVSGLPTGAISGFANNNKSELLRFLQLEIPFVSLSKGIDAETLEMSDDLWLKYFHDYQDQFCYLSGPSFADEIMEEQITLVSIAGKSKRVLETVCHMLCTDFFKTFATYDIKGLLLGGALKNILAIAGGVIEGLGYNHNTRAAMISRGITEMLRYGRIFNARPETFYGLSGMGDLILTTTGGLSRNKQFGLELAKGRRPKEIIESQRTVVEGYKTTMAARQLALRYDIRSRIFEGIYNVLYEDVDPKVVISEMMKTPPKFEID